MLFADTNRFSKKMTAIINDEMKDRSRGGTTKGHDE
jgi:hypothetical protein